MLQAVGDVKLCVMEVNGTHFFYKDLVYLSLRYVNVKYFIQAVNVSAELRDATYVSLMHTVETGTIEIQGFNFAQ